MGMRWTSARAAVAVAVVLCAAFAGGCGGSGSDLPMRSIAIFTPTSGPLTQRAADMRRAASLALDKIDHDTSGSRLQLVDGMRADLAPIASIDALAGTTVRATDELMVSLAPRSRTVTKATGPTQSDEPPSISLLPSVAATRDAVAQFLAVGGSAMATADNPLRAGTPKTQFVTPALTAAEYPPAGRDFFNAFREKYGRQPDRYAIYGYEAVGLIVDAINRLEKTAQAVNAASVAASALSIRDRYSPVGHYDVLPSGQSTLYVFQARGRGAPAGQAALFESVRQP